MHQGLVALPAHGFHHAQRGERVDETGGTLNGSRTLLQRQALVDIEAAVLGIHFTTDHADSAAQQGLGSLRAAGGHNDAGAFIAHRQRLIQPPSHQPHRGSGNLRRQHGSLRPATRAEGGGIGRRHQ